MRKIMQSTTTTQVGSAHWQDGEITNAKIGPLDDEENSCELYQQTQNSMLLYTLH